MSDLKHEHKLSKESSFHPEVPVEPPDWHVGYCNTVFLFFPFFLSLSSHQHIADLLQSSESRARMAGRARLSLSHTVLLSLSLLTERVSYRTVSRRFHLEKGNIHRIFFSFCERVNILEEALIRWPVGGLISVFCVCVCERYVGWSIRCCRF